MKIAFISDIHGNLSSLKAALKETEKHSVDLVVSLGGLVHYGPNPSEVINFIEENDIECIQGNCDRAIARNRTDTGENLSEEFANPHWRNITADFYRWTTEQITKSQKKWLKNLPVDLRFQVGKKTIHCVHGLPGDHSAELPFEAASEVYDAILAKSGSSIVVCGATHTPSIIRRPLGLILNPGSIGGGTVPSGGTIMILTFPEEGEPEVETLKYDYDVEEMKQTYDDIGIGKIFFDCIKLGRDQRGQWHSDNPKMRQQWAKLT